VTLAGRERKNPDERDGALEEVAPLGTPRRSTAARIGAHERFTRAPMSLIAVPRSTSSRSSPKQGATLERLGGERGFEADVDRVMTLVGLYELVGTREKLEAAVSVCRSVGDRKPAQGNSLTA
jgi:hypothetical protein